MGDIQIARGTYRLRGRDFEVERGSLSFTQDELSDPWLSFVARHDVRDVSIFVDVRGRASDLRLEMSSEPPMEQTEIVSYLMFGRPSSELGASDGAQLEVAAAQAAAAQVLAELFLNDIGSTLAAELPVDRISIGIDDESTLPTIEVEKQITEDILVRYDRSFSAQGGDQVEVEWRFWRHFNLQSDISSEGAGGVNLIWSRDY